MRGRTLRAPRGRRPNARGLAPQLHNHTVARRHPCATTSMSPNFRSLDLRSAQCAAWAHGPGRGCNKSAPTYRHFPALLTAEPGICRSGSHAPFGTHSEMVCSREIRGIWAIAEGCIKRSYLDVCRRAAIVRVEPRVTKAGARYRIRGMVKSVYPNSLLSTTDESIRPMVDVDGYTLRRRSLVERVCSLQ